MKNVLTTAGLTKSYSSLLAVQDLALQVGQGEIYGFLGLNGAGKTTTIRMLLGMIKPSRGTAHVLGMPVRADNSDLWSRVGYMVEMPYAYPDLTVRENLEVTRRLRRVTGRQVVERTIERLGLTPYADRRARTLSLGNAQRLGLAKALLHNPELLILDEPANGLDPVGVVEVRDLLRDLAHEHGVTVFMSSHILSEVARLATRIGILHQGRLIEEVAAGDLDRRRRRWLRVDAHDRCAASVALGAAGYSVSACADGALQLFDERAITAPDQIASLLVQAGTSPTHLSVEEDDLETHFLRLVGEEQGGA